MLESEAILICATLLKAWQKALICFRFMGMISVEMLTIVPQCTIVHIVKLDVLWLFLASEK
jgi:hypothetical protein